jgi:hypothetical protein
MKKALPFLLTLIVISCNKESTSNSSTSSGSVEYIVTATNPSASLEVFFNNTGGLSGGGFYLSGWTYTFTPSQKPFTASLEVGLGTYTEPSTTVTLRILVNGIVVEQVTGTVTAPIGNGINQQIQYVVN